MMVSIFCRFLLVSVTCFLAIVLSSQLSFAQTESGGESAAGSGAADGGAAATPPAPAPSQPANGGQKGTQVKGSKKTSINFEDQLIEGQAAKPELFYMIQQNNKNFKRLIQLRENFLPEMRKTSEDVVRKGSGN